jgi:hypothetical protein
VDLIALVAACSLTVDPKLMHALVWDQSSGEPRSFSVPGQHQPHIWRSAQQPVAEAHRSAPPALPIRIGLTVPRVDSDAAALALFMPCRAAHADSSPRSSTSWTSSRSSPLAPSRSTRS